MLIIEFIKDNPELLLQISIALTALALGYPAAKYYWNKYQVSYDLDISWHTSKKSLRCILTIINPNNTIIELKNIRAYAKKGLKKIGLQLASDIPVVRLDKELYFPSHFKDRIDNNVKIKKDRNYTHSFFVKIPDELIDTKKLFINLKINTRSYKISGKNITITRNFPLL